ncbi:MAG: chemotaxis response regulator protein-glutamate methylesterase [Pseudomonadota bacterium]
MSAATQRTRAVVVDDSPLMLKMITGALQEEGDIEVVAQAKDPHEARSLIKAHDPDVVTLDVEMPGMNGIEFLEKIMALRPMPVVMVSTLTSAGTDVTLNALQIGAVDAVAKPSGRDGLTRFGVELRQKVRAARNARVLRRPQPTASAPRPAAPPPAVPVGNHGAEVIAIGSSTGGVTALNEVMAGIPPNAPPILITQHMPARFTSRFAARMNGQFSLDVREATDGEALRPGTVRIAPGDRHLSLVRDGGQLKLRLDGTSGPISGHIPSVDVLFNSVCSVVGRNAIGVILTGMGRDGAAGLRGIKNAGGLTLGQSEASCVVYGMPKAAMALGAVTEELDVSQIAARICQFLNSPAAKKRA